MTPPVHPPTEEPDLTWDQELSRWVPAYRQTRWDHAAAEATSSTSLDPLEAAITAAILSAYRVPPDVLPAMVERVADAVGPVTAPQDAPAGPDADFPRADEWPRSAETCEHGTLRGAPCRECPDAPAGPVLGEEDEQREDIAHVLWPYIGSWTVARRVAAEVYATVFGPLLSSAREEGAAAERERIEKERERHARAALGLPPRPLDGSS